ncbi:rhodanese-like domain-containing protein [Clostridium folliculivorans]|uniref:Sulfurtransferase n=1 Tax=Clostridium folliculivorans TaxID=2886038 RepID=A0A9W6D9L6_9CLOT|nr:rhodanese-like domain-containing protein [Clostridium folliculivorans]GKU23897.1 sulfurtransferase [Clostridium folliculivorans]GKU30013.1 sulfurtransferase [Clostridium folliculivorans]
MFPFIKRGNFRAISVHDVDDVINKINLIDIREPYEYEDGHIPKAMNIPMGTILRDPEKYLDKEKEYHIICQSGGRSAKTCSELSTRGYKVVNVSGGTGSYLRPLEK